MTSRFLLLPWWRSAPASGSHWTNKNKNRCHTERFKHVWEWVDTFSPVSEINPAQAFVISRVLTVRNWDRSWLSLTLIHKFNFPWINTSPFQIMSQQLHNLHNLLLANHDRALFVPHVSSSSSYSLCKMTLVFVVYISEIHCTYHIKLFLPLIKLWTEKYLLF